MQKTTTQINIDLLMRALIKQNDLRFSYAVRAFLLYVKEPVFVQNKEAFLISFRTIIEFKIFAKKFTRMLVLKDLEMNYQKLIQRY